MHIEYFIPLIFAAGYLLGKHAGKIEMANKITLWLTLFTKRKRLKYPELEEDLISYMNEYRK